MVAKINQKKLQHRPFSIVLNEILCATEPARLMENEPAAVDDGVPPVG